MSETISNNVGGDDGAGTPVFNDAQHTFLTSKFDELSLKFSKEFNNLKKEAEQTTQELRDDKKEQDKVINSVLVIVAISVATMLLTVFGIVIDYYHDKILLSQDIKEIIETK